jgi:hypothetical protein
MIPAVPNRHPTDPSWITPHPERMLQHQPQSIPTDWRCCVTSDALTNAKVHSRKPKDHSRKQSAKVDEKPTVLK